MNLQLDKVKARLLLTSVSRSLKELSWLLRDTPLPGEAKRKVMSEVNCLIDIGGDIHALMNGVKDEVTERVERLEKTLDQAHEKIQGDRPNCLNKHKEPCFICEVLDDHAWTRRGPKVLRE